VRLACGTNKHCSVSFAPPKLTDTAVTFTTGESTARLVDPHCGLCFAPQCTACAAVAAVSCVLAKATVKGAAAEGYARVRLRRTEWL
jgi:hypothetical protein